LSCFVREVFSEEEVVSWDLDALSTIASSPAHLLNAIKCFGDSPLDQVGLTRKQKVKLVKALQGNVSVVSDEPETPAASVESNDDVQLYIAFIHRQVRSMWIQGPLGEVLSKLETFEQQLISSYLIHFTDKWYSYTVTNFPANVLRAVVLNAIFHMLAHNIYWNGVGVFWFYDHIEVRSDLDKYGLIIQPGNEQLHPINASTLMRKTKALLSGLDLQTLSTKCECDGFLPLGIHVNTFSFLVKIYRHPKTM